ncbi:Ferritin-like protein [Venustampulla echinocandica]|uniref:Ferritin-like protein n=1 Tax=Venustampulla echinocandica TaxID=2656787 RepID=A0A370TCT8_9HELO|nr:Ferritin-like protein [Venustampulla echinocandica]RDL32044.1 Ferritin-like protein [Venustampulla echinocandica]
MPSLRQILGAVAVGFATVTSAAPAFPKLDPRTISAYNAISARQNPATGLPDGLTDVDILQFALTLEFLETAFYEEGFAKFPESDFTALGLQAADITNLKSILTSEQTHVTTLLSAISGAGVKPVAPCKYKFGLTDAAGMVATAAILENVGVSAYLGAAPLVTTPSILSVAASIVTVEARHQTFIRVASKAEAIPSPFDTALGIRNVFTLAAGFIESCPEGSNLLVTPFPAVTMGAASANTKVLAGQSLALESSASAGATFCAFTNAGAPGGTAFSPFTGGACVVPQNLKGFTYVNLASAGPATGVLTDGITLAGPMVMQVS